MQMYWGSGGIVLCILKLGTGWRWVVSFMPWPLYSHGKSPCYPTGQEAGCDPELVWMQWRERIPSLPLPGTETQSPTL